MYLDALVRVPQVKGKITFRTKGNTTYVEFENERVYLPEKKYTVVNRKTIGKLSGTDNRFMQPNENFLRFFPEVELPEERDRTSRSCGLRIGTWIVIRRLLMTISFRNCWGDICQERTSDCSLILQHTQSLKKIIGLSITLHMHTATRCSLTV